MDEEYVKQIATTAWQQLFWSVNMWTVMSWGVSKKCFTNYQGMPTLMLRVTGLIHKGWVYISLNEGKDVYEVRLMTTKRKCKKTIDEVYCDQLGRVIDELIEKPSNMSDEEYKIKADADSNAKMCH
jgi:hypothetical protein